MVKTGYKTTNISMIPNNWELVKLGSVIKELKSGLSRKLSAYDIGLPVIRSNNIIDHKVDFTDIRYWYIDDPQGANTDNYILRDDDVLVNFINSISQIGKCAKHKNALGRNTIYTTNIMRLRLNNKILVNYFLAITQTQRYKNFIFSITKPAVNQASFTTKDYRSFLISLPPLPEQKKIAEILGTWDEGIEKVVRLIAAKQKLKKGLMQQLLTGKKRFKEFKGQKWEEVKLGKYVKLQGGYAFKSEEFQESGIPIIRISNINGSGVNIDKDIVFYNIISISDDFIVKCGDLLIAMSGATTGKVGRYLNNSEVYLNQRVGKFVIRNQSKINLEYLSQLVFSWIFRKGIASDLAAGAQPNISSRSVESIKIPITNDIKEQQRIASVLNTCDKEIGNLKQKLDALKKQKKGLMQKLLTGKIRVKN